MNEKILQMRNVAKVFDGREMIHGMNLSVERGMIYGLLGVNGAGKTTTFKMITGLLRPDSGEIIFSGTSVSGQDKEFLREMGILIETPVFYEHLSARENLELHLQYMGCGVDKIEEVLNRAGLQNTGRQPVSKFSLGMRQRLAIARAISHGPKLLVLDEPVNGLDPVGIRQMRELFLSLARESGMTLLISGHILSEIEHVADRVGVLADGSIAKEVSMAQVRKDCPEGLEDYFFNIMGGGVRT
ncbi:ATP-binding cassette domain-containing protein [Candidatus Ventrimonas sp. KK005]